MAKHPERAPIFKLDALRSLAKSGAKFTVALDSESVAGKTRDPDDSN